MRRRRARADFLLARLAIRETLILHRASNIIPPAPETFYMKARFFIIALVILGSLGLLAFGTGSSADSIVIVDTTAVVDNPRKYTADELRVRGFVKPGSVLRYGDEAEFIVEQDGRELPVHFTGETQLPDTFTDSAPVRVDGHLKEGKLIATKVEAKCASKYDAEYAEKHGATPPAAGKLPQAADY